MTDTSTPDLTASLAPGATWRPAVPDGNAGRRITPEAVAERYRHPRRPPSYRTGAPAGNRPGHGPRPHGRHRQPVQSRRSHGHPLRCPPRIPARPAVPTASAATSRRPCSRPSSTRCGSATRHEGAASRRSSHRARLPQAQSADNRDTVREETEATKVNFFTHGAGRQLMTSANGSLADKRLRMTGKRRWPPALPDPVHDAPGCFRTIMNAMARPGTRQHSLEHRPRSTPPDAADAARPPPSH